MAIVFLVLLVSAFARGDDLCDLVAEGQIAHVSCAHGGVVGITSALFGEFTTNSSCSAKIAPSDNCTVSIQSTIAQLCVGRCQCNFFCT